MLSAREARNRCNDKLLNSLNFNNNKYLPDIKNILQRIEEVLEENEIIYSIHLSSIESYYVTKTNILQNLGYIITLDTTYPWGATISW